MFHKLHIARDIVRMIKLRRLRWTGYLECMGDTRNTCNILIGNPHVIMLFATPKIKVG